MRSTKKHDFMLPDLAMPSHLHSSSQPFLIYQIANRDSDSDEQLSSYGGSGSGPGYQPECESSIPGAWPEWSEAEDEQQESETEECKATEEQQMVAQMIGQPAAG